MSTALLFLGSQKGRDDFSPPVKIILGPVKNVQQITRLQCFLWAAINHKYKYLRL